MSDVDKIKVIGCEEYHIDPYQSATCEDDHLWIISFERKFQLNELKNKLNLYEKKTIEQRQNTAVLLFFSAKEQCKRFQMCTHLIVGKQNQIYVDEKILIRRLLRVFSSIFSLLLSGSNKQKMFFFCFSCSVQCIFALFAGNFICSVVDRIAHKQNKHFNFKHTLNIV